ncbi:IS3 family transposase [Paenibacillus ehimensis]|uniref:IS3 family transposase n=1 Tax=Paenibacillus ehimensis TaxID=79264 RepID=A0ABT8VMA5_9BACL|nr:IS3 family transposase [Paenibacillus ehimensis]MDO3682101.1 IS3 family transposase [Paenibacillus ehimensis]
MKGKYAIIAELAGTYPVTHLCDALNVNRSAYYRYMQRKAQDPDREVIEQIQTIYDQYRSIYGYRRIQVELKRQYGVKVNHKKVLRLMQEIGIRSIIRAKRPYFNTYQIAQSDGRVTANLLERNFTADKPNQKWVTDVTQFRVGEQRLYLSAIKDLYGKDIVAFHISERNDNELVLRTFDKAFKQHKDVSGLIVHSDQGFQYTSHAYHDMLPTVGAQISMSRRGNCLDNAAMESFFSHLKAEALYPYDIRSIQEAQERIEAFIHFYNEERIQLNLNKLTPMEYRRQLAA